MTVDLSTSVENQTQSIEHWIKFLQAHLQFKYLNKRFSVIIVETKKDIKGAKENMKMIENELKDSKYSSTAFIAAKKHDNMKTLQSQILEHSNSLLNQCKIILPKYYLKMAELIRSLKDEGRICCTTQEVIIQGLELSRTTCLQF